VNLEPAHLLEPPVVFFFQGSGEGEAKYWGPFEDVVRAVPLSYLDWTELVKPETGFAGVILHLKAQIQSRMPAGPLHLVGYSIGGPLAYACAIALQAEGRVVDCLAILDGHTSLKAATWRQRFADLATFEVRSGLARVLSKLLTNRYGLPVLRRLSAMRRVKLPFNFGAYLHPKLRVYLMWRMFGPWWRTVAPPNAEFTVPTLLFRAKESQRLESDDLGWRRYCQNLTVIQVAASHFNILAAENFGPLCADLARVLRGSST
jgi:thioesterase domain-containing protein